MVPLVPFDLPLLASVCFIPVSGVGDNSHQKNWAVYVAFLFGGASSSKASTIVDELRGCAVPTVGKRMTSVRNWLRRSSASRGCFVSAFAFPSAETVLCIVVSTSRCTYDA